MGAMCNTRLLERTGQLTQTTKKQVKKRNLAADNALLRDCDILDCALGTTVSNISTSVNKLQTRTVFIIQ